VTPSFPRSTPEQQGVDPRAVLTTVEAITAIPELHSLMLVRHGHVVAEGWAAPFAPDRRQTVYSLSKTFTATAIGFAVAEGLLSLDDPVVGLLPDEAPDEPDERLARMTVRHLLTMASGHDPEPAVMAEPGGWVARFLATPLAHEPGERFVYNTPATHVLSAIVQRASGQRLLDYLEPRLLEPLGITGAWSEISADGIDVGGVGISVTTEDIAKLGQLYLQDGLWEGRRVLPEGWAAQAGAAQVSTAHWGGTDWQQGYGFQMWRSQHGFRADGAFGQFSLVLPEVDAVVAITAGFRDTGRVLDAVWTHLLPGLHDEALAPDDEGRAALGARLAGLRLDPPAGEAVTQTARRIAGSVVELDGSPLGPLSVTFVPGEEADELVVRTARGETTLRPGHAEPTAQRVTSVFEQRHSPEALVSGTWTRPDQYVLTLRWVETPHVLTVQADVDGDRVTVAASANVSFGPTEFEPSVGRLVAAAVTA
jgi:CubicO group peptidase (beta-lactamase class C family)